MSFDEIIDNTRDKIDELRTEKPHVFIAIVVIVVFFFIGLVVLLIQTSPKKIKEKPKMEFIADAPIMIPDAPNVEKDYYQYRTTPDKWNKDDIEKWFTYPDEKIMNQLEKSNDSIIDDITGAAL